MRQATHVNHLRDAGNADEVGGFEKAPAPLPRCWRHDRERVGTQITVQHLTLRKLCPSTQDPDSNRMQIVQQRRKWSEVGNSYILPQFDLSNARCSPPNPYELNPE